MSSRATEHVNALVAFLRAHGAEIVEVDWAHKHPRIVYRHNGVERFQLFSSTQNDSRALHKAKKDIRHALGIVGGPKKVGARRQRREQMQKMKRPPLPQLHITPGRSPFAALLDHPLADEVARIRLRAAWQRFWDAHLWDAGNGPPWWRIRAASQSTIR